MNSLMEYKGYHAKVDFDYTDQIFVGEVLGITDSLYFHGTSVHELVESFHNSIDNYLDYCAQCGKKPEKEFRGVFNVRIKPEMHRCAALEAAKEGVTMNQFVSEAIQEKLAEKGAVYG